MLFPSFCPLSTSHPSWAMSILAGLFASSICGARFGSLVIADHTPAIYFEDIRNITQHAPSSAQIHCLLLIHRLLFMEIQNVLQRENAKVHQLISALSENKRTSRQKVEVHEGILRLTNIPSTHSPYIQNTMVNCGLPTSMPGLS